jgi:hypothetical protein
MPASLARREGKLVKNDADHQADQAEHAEQRIPALVPADQRPQLACTFLQRLRAHQ